jgi:two-component system sensor histidine kinase BarA
MNKHCEDKNWKALGEVAHRLHGACAVCGVPALRAAVSNLEHITENENASDILNALQSVETCSDQLLMLERSIDI